MGAHLESRGDMRFSSSAAYRTTKLGSRGFRLCAVQKLLPGFANVERPQGGFLSDRSTPRDAAGAIVADPADRAGRHRVEAPETIGICNLDFV